jgi:hypothetical protein
MATTLAPAINITNVSKGLKSLNTGVENLKKSSDSIKTVTLNRTKIKRESFARDKILASMREESVRRKDQESLIESSGIGGAMKRSATVIADSTKGFLGRILDFASSLLIGWLLFNLPTIITAIQDLVTRITSLTQILRDFISNITDTFINFGSLLSGVYQNIIQFDFTDQSKRVQNAMDDLNVNLETMRDQFMQGFDLLTKPLGEGPGEEPVPELNTDYTQPGPTTGGGQDLYTLATIANLESGSAQGQADVAQSIYNRMKKSGKGVVDVTTSPGQYEPFFGKSSKDIDPQSKNIKTFDDAVKYRMKKTGENRATAERSVLGTISAIQDPSKQAAAREFVGTRTSFRGSPQNTGNYLRNVTWRGSRSDNQFLNEENVSGIPGNIPSFVSSPTKQTGASGNATFGSTGNVRNAPNWVHGHFQTNTGTANDVINDTAPIVKGLLNSGITPELSRGQKFSKNMSMEEIKNLIKLGLSQHGHSGDGRSVDIFVPEGTKVPFPLSDVRDTGGRGGVTGVLLGSGKTWVGHLDPKSKSGGTKPIESSSLAQISPTTQPGQNVPSVAQDRRGQQIIIADNPQQPQPQQVSAGGGGSQSQTIPTETSLNSLIKNQILLELAYT